MGKIVVLASGADADSATTALEGAGLDFEIVDPKPANLLHIVIGMVDDGEKEDKEEKEPKEPKEPKDPAADEPPADEEPPADDADIASDASAVPESLGSVRIGDELIVAVRGTGPVSVLRSVQFQGGAHATYSINESVYSFWPADPVKPMHRVVVENKGRSMSLEVLVKEASGNQSYLEVGDDLAALFAAK